MRLKASLALKGLIDNQSTTTIYRLLHTFIDGNNLLNSNHFVNRISKTVSTCLFKLQTINLKYWRNEQ